MNRKYPFKHSLRMEDLFTIVEGQLEFLVDNEFGNIAEIVSNMSDTTYENFIQDLANDLDNENELWTTVDNTVTDIIKERITNYLS